MPIYRDDKINNAPRITGYSNSVQRLALRKEHNVPNPIYFLSEMKNKGKAVCVGPSGHCLR
jgi:hypothetical protein